MAFEFPTSVSGAGPFNQIVETFNKSLNAIFGLTGDKKSAGKLQTISDLMKSDGVGHQHFVSENWTGNTDRKSNKLRYGFTTVNVSNISKGLNFSSDNKGQPDTYYLDIPPQAISQKELFATNITASRRGVVVESEGVIFKDLVIAGTTGVYPGPREGFGGNQANFSNPLSAPTKAGGVQANGTSKASTVVSGYAEFLGLRAYFLKYANDKVKKRGNHFLVFINEKDQQALVVEPLEFTMERNSKNPMQYQYRIVLKCITTIDALFAADQEANRDPGIILNDIVNISRNAVAAIQQFRAAVGATNRLVQSISQEIDKTFIQPLRLLGTALNDVADARSNILAVPTALQRNLNEALLTIQESRFEKSRSEMSREIKINTQNPSRPQTPADVKSGKISERGSTDAYTSKKLLDKSQAENFVNSAVQTLEQSSVNPLSKSFVQDLRDKAQALANDIADTVNLGNADFNTIQNRSPSFIPNPLRSATSNEFLLLGQTLKVVAVLNQVLATNNLFLINVQATFDNDQSLLQNIATLQAPTTVREIVIGQNDTLERIALREYGNVARWVDLAVLNNLKYPYIADNPSDPRISGVKVYGEKLLIGN